MDRMLVVGPEYWNPRNASFPAVAVRLARALGKPARVEVALKTKGGMLRLLRDGKEVFKAEVPTEFAVIYVPKDKYEWFGLAHHPERGRRGGDHGERANAAGDVGVWRIG